MNIDNHPSRAEASNVSIINEISFRRKVPVLSVVCAVYNAAPTIGDMLKSYEHQKNQYTELIIIDGASTDNTLEIIKSSGLADKLLSEPDKGIYDAWNKAIALCSGTYVSFIGADDILADCCLLRIVQACNTASEEIKIIAGFNVLTRNRHPVKIIGEICDISRLSYRMPFAHVMSAHRLSWLRSIGGFDSSYTSAADYEILFRSSDSLSIQTIFHFFAFMEDGGSSTKGVRPLLEHARIRRKYGVSSFLIAFILLKGIFGFLKKN